VIGEAFPEVLQAAQAGDSDALGRLYSECAPRVLGYLRSQGIADHEDIAAEVFVSMVRNLGSFHGDEDSFRGWVFTIAQRRLVDERRRRGRRPEEPFETEDLVEVLGTGAVGEGGVENEALERLRTSGLLEAIEQLTPDQRAVLYLRAVGDLSVPDIARALDKPETAVKALLRRAAATLNRRLAEREGGE
jgi:RNA polymerase sigma factor (sigma-70 family)